MPIARRRLLASLVAVPGIMVAGRVAALVESAVASAARAARPPASGTSTTRCAQCGSSEHGMLDPRCPLAPRVLG